MLNIIIVYLFIEYNLSQQIFRINIDEHFELIVKHFV